MSVRFLTDSVALVTASTKGIGFAVAKRLGLDGAKVVVSSRKEYNVHEAVKALRMENIDCEGFVADVGLKADRQKLVDFTIESYNKLDILVSNSPYSHVSNTLSQETNAMCSESVNMEGLSARNLRNVAVNPHYSNMMDISDSQWDKMLNVNVKSAFLLTQEALPHLEKSTNASIVFVSSIAGYAPIDGIGAYSVMKAALNGVTKSLSQSLARRNIRVNAIAPGIIRTDFSKMLTGSEDAMDPNKLIPLGRFGEADECAGAVSFLVSANASYLTGETIGINGGMHARV